MSDFQSFRQSQATLFFFLKQYLQIQLKVCGFFSGHFQSGKKKNVQQKTYTKFVSEIFVIKKVGSRTSNFMPNSVNILKRPRRKYLQCIQTTNQKFHIFLRCPQTSETYMFAIMFPKKNKCREVAQRLFIDPPKQVR